MKMEDGKSPDNVEELTRRLLDLREQAVRLVHLVEYEMDEHQPEAVALGLPLTSTQFHKVKGEAEEIVRQLDVEIANIKAAEKFRMMLKDGFTPPIPPGSGPALVDA